MWGAILYFFWDGFSEAGSSVETGPPFKTWEARPQGRVFEARPQGRVWESRK